MPSSPLTQFDIDALRIKLGFWAIIVGFSLTGIALALGVDAWLAHMKSDTVASGDVVALVGSVTGVIGTVIGTFFGVNVGAAGRTQSEMARQDITNKALNLAGQVDPTRAAAVLGIAPGATPGPSTTPPPPPGS